MSNTNFQTIHQMGDAINQVVRQATGRDAVDNIDMDFVTVAQNKIGRDVNVSGSVASFVANAAVPIKSLIVNIEPVQSGSGDPSPSNIRPISGWTGATVTRAGKNLLDLSLRNISGGGTVTVSNENNGLHFQGTKEAGKWMDVYFNTTTVLLAGVRYVLSFNLINNPNITWGLSLIVGSTTPYVITSSNNRLEITPTANVKISTVQITARTDSGSTFDTILQPMIRLASDTDATFEPYQGNTYNISFGSAGTVYGGTLNVTTGELVVDRAIATYNGTEAWTDSYIDDRNMFYLGVLPNDFNLGRRPDVVFNSRKNEDSPQVYGGLAYYGSAGLWVNMMTASDTLADFKATLAQTPLQALYYLNSPTIYHLTPTEVKTLLGKNNIWADTGEVSVSFINVEEGDY